MFRDVHERRFEHFSNWYFDEMTRTIGDWPTSPSAAFAHWRHCFLQYFDNPAHIRKDERWVAQEIDRRMWPDEIG